MVQNRQIFTSSSCPFSGQKIGLSLSLSMLVKVMVSVILILSSISFVDSYNVIPNGQRVVPTNDGSHIQNSDSISRRQVMKDLFVTMATTGAVSLTAPMPAGAESYEGNVNGASNQHMKASNKNDIKKQKEDAKRKEKEAARIAQETKQRLAAGRIGII